jgi:hypothetical protein
MIKMTKFQFGTFTAPTAANEWDEAAEAFIENAVDEAGEINREFSIDIQVPGGLTKEGEDAEGNPDRVKFQRAVRERGYTARFRASTGPDKDGNYTLTFTLTPKQIARRGGAAEDSISVDESATVADEATAE